MGGRAQNSEEGGKTGLGFGVGAGQPKKVGSEDGKKWEKHELH